LNEKRTRKNSFVLRLDDNEMRILQERMQAVGVKNREMFARKMLLDGYIINVDLKPIAELVRLTRNISNNINQIARRANECGCVYENDVLNLISEVSRLKPLLAEAHREAIRLCKH
jgi:hypothetical protein